MAQTNYTPISLYYSTTASAVPTDTNLVSGELAINITDGKLFYKDNNGVVQTLATSNTANGTANGVLYLNGSKAVTSGSALTFDGTNFATTGKVTANGRSSFIGASEPFSVYLRYNSSTNGIYLGSSAADTLNAYDSAGNPFYSFAAAADIFYVGGSEQMRLTSTGLGIGTSSPNSKLQVQGLIRTSSSAAGIQIDRRDTSISAYTLYSTAGNLQFYNGTSDVMTLDTSGNLGLGVTPSAWSGIKAIQVGTAASFSGGSGFNDAFTSSNAYYDGTNWKYINSNPAYYASIGGSAAARWYTAASGTAGYAITFTQAMTLDASGNLGVGLTSASNRIHVQTATTGSVDAIRWTDGATDTGYLGIVSGGGARLWAGGFLAFGSGGGSSFTERARIDSSGNLLVGTTDNSATSGIGVKVDYSATAPFVATVGSQTTSANSAYLLYSTGAAAFRFYVGYDGVVHATSTSISAISDVSLKTNIKDLETGLTEVMALKPRRFDWINGDAKNVAGFIAQEVEQVLPELVAESLYSQDEEGNPVTKKNLKMGDILPTLVKAMQEQQAIIENLKARLDAANL